MGKRRGGGGGRGGGRGGRGGGGGGDDFEGGGGGLEDQYGGFGSQDKDSFQPFSSKSGGGGGSAGGTAGSRSKPGANLSFQRQVPKFLQKYQHMLGGRGGQPSEDEPTMDEGSMAALKGKFGGNDDDDEDEDAKAKHDDDIEVEALKRAMAENPQLAKEFEGTLAKQLAQAEALEEKERGNKLFSSKKYSEAIQSFTRCIQLDPSNEVYFSNRSAAHASLEQWEDALHDAKRAAALKPRWAKAHQRLGTAYMGLQLYSEAKEAYEQAAKIEPDNQAVQTALQKAEIMELQQVRDKKHMFKKRKLVDGSSGTADVGVMGVAEKSKKGASLLSFADDDV